MDLWLLLMMYLAGLFLIGLEMFLPGMVVGLMGGALAITAIIMAGTEHSWWIAGVQILILMVAVPGFFWYGSKRMALKAALSSEDGAVSFSRNNDVWLGREGETETDLRPAGLVRIDGKKLDVVTGGESILQGTPVRVTKVEGNIIVVKEVQER